MSRSIRSVRFSRRSCPSSSRSAVVSAPGVPRPASISACRTQLRSAVSVRSSSRATVGTDLPLSRTSRTASALNSLVNARRFRLAMTHSYRTFVRSGVSTKPGQVHSALLLMYVGCATAGPQQVPPEYAHIQDFVAKASAAYGMDIPRIVATDWEDRAAIRYQDRQLYVSRKTLSYSDAILEPLLAHELCHHIPGHPGSVSPQDETAANAGAVRSLAKL